MSQYIVLSFVNVTLCISQFILIEMNINNINFVDIIFVFEYVSDSRK